MWPRRQVRRLVCASLALQLVVRLTRATIAMENVDVELFKINSTVWPAQANQKLTSNSTSALKPLGPTDLVQASASAHGPPIYRSAPMQIDSIGSKSLAGQPKHSVDNPTALASPRGQQEMSPDDLNTAAGHHKKKKHKKKKKKVIIVKKKKRKKHHKKKKKKKKIIVVKKKKHHKKHHKKKKKKKKVIHYKPKHSHRVKQFYHAPAVHLHNHHELEELHHKPIYHEPHEPARHRHYAAAPTGKYFE